jgi:hypothetical protein
MSVQTKTTTPIVVYLLLYEEQKVGKQNKRKNKQAE